MRLIERSASDPAGAEAGHPADIDATVWEATTRSHAAQRSLQRSLTAAPKQDRQRKVDAARHAQELRAEGAAAAHAAMMEARLQRLRFLASQSEEAAARVDDSGAYMWQPKAKARRGSDAMGGKTWQ